LPQSQTSRPRNPDAAGVAAGVSLAFGLLAFAPAAHATLGGGRDSLEHDRAGLSASLISSAAATHTVHALTLPNGVLVREFMRPDGTVFAVTWRGQGRPNLRLLLGDSFQTLQADNAPRPGQRIRTPLAVRRPDLMIQSGGHSGAFWGIALLPKMAPAGFAARDLAVAQ
jgi:hypothetical protein